MTEIRSEGPLAGIKVLDLAWVVAGPKHGRSLADFGATVIRVESPKRIETARNMGPFYGGTQDPQRSALYGNCNAGKLGLTLDLATDDGRAVAMDLAEWADVVVESFAPGQMKRWGMGYEAIKARNPSVIMLSTSLMGQSGPWTALAGFGNIGGAMAGYQGLAGPADGLPVGPFGPYTDYVGPRFGLPALLAALDHRRRTDEGCWLDVAQAETGMQFLASALADCAATGRVATPEGNRDPAMAPHGVFPAETPEGADPRWVAIACRTDAEWRRLAEAMGETVLAADPGLATLEGRKVREAELEATIAAWTERRPPEETEALLQGLGVPAHVVASAADLAADAQLEQQGHWARLVDPGFGEATVEAARFDLSRTPGHPPRTAPSFGRDNDHVLREILGYAPDRIEALADAGALG